MPEIREWKDIDADWLTAALKEDGIDARVSSSPFRPLEP